MIKYLSAIIFIVVIFSFSPEKPLDLLEGDQNVVDLLEELGEDYSDKKANLAVAGADPRIGENLVKLGFSKEKGLKKAKRQSKHFVCTSCHNTVREDPKLNLPTPQNRLIYVNENKLPFLQATTLFGAVNRETYYNGDYEKKYGKLVYPARKNIREAIQLCATECSQGRKLKDWELESILAYLWELQMKIKDLELTDQEIKSIEMAIENDVIKIEAAKLIKSKYSLKSEATWVEPPKDRKLGTGLTGIPENGKLLYESSCLHCHYQKKYSFLHLDNSKMSFKHLNAKANTFQRHSVYQVVRYGTYSKNGKKAYMPFYTQERMSDQQLSDLRSYIEQQAK